MDSKTSAGNNFRDKSESELFTDFYLSIKGKEMDQERIEVLNKVLEEIGRG